MAAHHGLPASALMTVVSGLARYARDGGRPARAEELVRDFRALAVHADEEGQDLAARIDADAGARVDTGVSEHDSASDAPEWVSDSPSNIARLAMLCVGVLTLGVVLVVQGLGGSPRSASDNVVNSTAEDGSGASGAGRGSGAGLRPTRPGEDSPGTRTTTGDGGSFRVDRSRLAFRTMPGFRGPGPSQLTLGAADTASSIIADLDELARRVEVNPSPTVPVTQRWTLAIETIDRAWPLLGRTDRAAIESGLRNVVRRVEPTIEHLDMMFTSLTLPSVQPIRAIDVWRGAWRAGFTASLIDDRDMPDRLRTYARERLEATERSRQAALSSLRPSSLSNDPLLELIRSTPDPGRPTNRTEMLSWLRWTGLLLASDDAMQMPTPLGLDAGDMESAEEWEHWLRAIQSIPGGNDRQQVIADVVLTIGRVGAPFEPRDLATGVAARLSGMLPADSLALRDLALKVTSDRDTPLVAARAILSILFLRSDLPGLELRDIPPGDATENSRERLSIRMAESWPEPTAEAPIGIIVLAPEDRADWFELASAVQRVVAAEGDVSWGARLRRAAAISGVNETAALFAAGETERAREQLVAVRSMTDQLQAGSDGPSQSVLPALVPVEPGDLGADGTWTAEMDERSRNREASLTLLRALRTRADADLGPIDARTLADLCFRGGSADLRSEARSLLIQRFPLARNIAIATLDAFRERGTSNDDLSRFLERYTATRLPRPQNATWAAEARRGLVQHVASLLPVDQDEVRQISIMLAISHQRRAAILLRTAAPADSAAGGVNTAVGDAAAELATAWRRELERVMAVDPVPAPRHTIDAWHARRLRNSTGPVTTSVAEMWHAFTSATGVVAGERPGLRRETRDVYSQVTTRMDDSRDAIEQLILLDSGMAELWRMRFGITSPISEVLTGTVAATSGAHGETRRNGPLTRQDSRDEPMEMSLSPELNARLLSLRPSEPLEYIVLAEDVRDGATSRGERELARSLFALAAVLEPSYARGVMPAIVDLEDDRRTRQRLRTVMMTLPDPVRIDGGQSAREQRGAGVLRDRRTRQARLEFGRFFSSLRRSDERGIRDASSSPGVDQLLDQFCIAWPGGPEQLRRLAAGGDGLPIDRLSLTRLRLMLQIEEVALGGDIVDWGADLVVTDGAPLIDVDPSDLSVVLGIDPQFNIVRRGAWARGGD